MATDEAEMDSADDENAEAYAPGPFSQFSEHLIFSEGGGVTSEFTYCHLDIMHEGNLVVCDLIAIALIESKILVAVPQNTWHRAVARRVLPKNSLSKPVLFEVPGEGQDAGEAGATQVKLWVGYLAKDFDSNGVAGPYPDPGAFTFIDDAGNNCKPSAESLVRIANEQFEFVSAQSHVEGELDAVVSRVSALESMLQTIQTTLVELPKQLAPTAKTAVAKPTAKIAPKTPVAHAHGIDPGVAAAALQAGVPEAHLAKIAALFNKQPKTMGDLPRNATGGRNVLSESQEEADPEVEQDEVAVDGEDLSPSSAVERAVVQLTKLVSDMNRRKKTSSGFEGLLERSEGSNADAGSASSSGTRSKAAAYAKLKASLTEKPEWLYTSVEDKLAEDFHSVRSAPGSSAASATSRGWVEHRSKLGNYPATVRFAWVVAGIHDCLRQGDTEQARARCALALAAIDQASLDQGSWTLAQEMLLELPPPYQSFSNHRIPDSSEQVATRLADDRLMEIMMWRVKDRDNFLESRRRLGQANKPKAPPAVPPSKATPKWQPKGKAKPKAGASSEEHGGGDN